MKNNTLHIILASALVLLLALLSDPFMIWMPPMAVTFTLVAVAVIMSVWAGFVMKEQVRDEREAMHRMNAGRAAYLSGIVILTLAFIVQGFSHHIDPWISATLMVMVVVKLIARIYFDRCK